jgi:hypothetical protein
MNDETGNYATVDAQLKALIAGRIESMAGEADFHDHFRDAMADLKARRGELWRCLQEHNEDTRAFAHALLTYQVPPVALVTHESAAEPAPLGSSIKPPSPISNLRERTRQIAEMLAPPIINGRPNQLAKRVNG